MEDSNSLDFDYEAFFTLHLDLLCILDKAGNFLHINRAFEETLGYQIHDLYLQSTIDLIHPSDLSIIQKELEHLRYEQKSLIFTVRVRHKNGTYKYIEWSSQFMGKYIYASARDISEHKIRAIQLQNHYVQLSAILKNNKNFVLHLDANFNYTHYNHIVQEYFATVYGKDDFLGMPCFDGLTFMQPLQETCLVCMSHIGKVLQTEMEIINKDNTTTYILWDCIALYNDNTKVQEIQCIGLNITERKLAKIKEKQEQEKHVLSLNTPISELWEQILFLPLVGKLSASRAAHTLEAVLNKITTLQAKFLIIDISGILIINDEVATYILKLNKGVKLMGCACILVGISPHVAKVIIDLNIDINEIITTNHMQTALNIALKHGGYQLITLSAK